MINWFFEEHNGIIWYGHDSYAEIKRGTLRDAIVGCIHIARFEKLWEEVPKLNAKLNEFKVKGQ